MLLPQLVKLNKVIGDECSSGDQTWKRKISSFMTTMMMIMVAMMMMMMLMERGGDLATKQLPAFSHRPHLQAGWCP